MIGGDCGWSDGVAGEACDTLSQKGMHTPVCIRSMRAVRALVLGLRDHPL